MQENEHTAPSVRTPATQAPAVRSVSEESRLARPRRVEGGRLEPAKLLLKPQEAQQKLDELRAACVAAGDLPRPVEDMVEELCQSGYKQESNSILLGSLDSDTVRPEVGALWMRRIVNRRTWNRRYPDGMDALCARGEVGRRAVIVFVEAAGAARKGALVRRALRKHGKWLREHPLGWGIVARALTEVSQYGQVRRWMADWRQKPELELPLLRCLVVGLRGCGRSTEAREVLRLALDRYGGDPQVQPIKLWRAMDEALAGNTEAASATFKDLSPSDWDQDSFNRYYLVRGMIRVQKAEKDLRGEAFESAHQRVKDHFRRPPVYRRHPLVRREYRECVCRMARDAGDWREFCAAIWRSSDSWALLFPLLVVPGLQLLLPLYLFRLCTHRSGRS